MSRISDPLSRPRERARERAGLASRGARVAGAGAAAFQLFAATAHAQDKRPSEDEMFGGASSDKPSTPPAPAPGAPPPAGAQPSPAGAQPPAAAGGALPPPPTSGEPASPTVLPPAAAASTTGPQLTPAQTPSRDDALLGNPEAGPRLSAEVAPENPLTIGGQLYLRAQATAQMHTYPDKWTLATPNLLDTYFDARPNERVRAFIRGRLSFDPTAPPVGTSMPATGSQTSASGGAIAGTSATGFTTFNASRGPNTILDQMWIAFDIEHKVFVTAGKQHVKWGTGRFWTPTDYLHPIKRNPLDVFDARPGTSMLKVHFPWESRAWNFYGFAVYEDPNAATNTLGEVAGAGRVEIVEGPAELGLDFFAKRGQKVRGGVDFSIGIGDFDLYTDIGIRAGSDFPIVTVNPAPACPPDLTTVYHVTTASGVKTQAVGGFTYARKYNDNDVFNLGGEYFYNSVGYSDPSIYPGLIFNDSHQPQLNFFYTGKHYAALFASMPAPYSWNYTTFTLSTIGNLSDKSFVTRLDYSVTLLTHLTFEAFAGAHYGHLGGEFRLGLEIPAQYNCPPPGVPPTLLAPALQFNAPVVDLGVALRLAI